MSRIAAFIDRDGVISHEVKHPEIVDAQGRACSDPLSPDELVFYPRVAEAFALLKAHGILTCIVSNQVGFAKGFFPVETLEAVKAKMRGHCKPDGIYYCTHHEDYTGPCECKKPKKGMLLAAAKDHDIDISRSFMIGDRRIDMQTGDGCRACFMVASREGEDPHAELAKLDPELQKRVVIVKDLYEAAQRIVALVNRP
ncbi:TPA: HAD-IIIA family hydrolase [Candidatus Woesearchaeota archaeon]|nr:HAD-IIIA family hydrolase [Candidatus Woesearchaeota archaeon]